MERLFELLERQPLWFRGFLWDTILFFLREEGGEFHRQDNRPEPRERQELQPTSGIPSALQKRNFSLPLGPKRAAPSR